MQIERPTQTVYFADGEAGPNYASDKHYNYICLPGGAEYVFTRLSDRHLETTNALFMDGHVKAMKKTELEKTGSNPDNSGVFTKWGYQTGSTYTTTIHTYWSTSAAANTYF